LLGYTPTNAATPGTTTVASTFTTATTAAAAIIVEEHHQTFIDRLFNLFSHKSDNGSTNNLTDLTTNTTSNHTSLLSSMFSIDPVNMSDIGSIFSATLRAFAQALMIFGGVVPYIPQYLIIKRTQNAEGFSNYVCLTLLVANIIRIEFWFGKHFETPLLLQSIVMIICMLVMLELWTRVHSRSMRHHLPINQQATSGSKEQLTESIEKRFTDFEVNFFWRWTTFTSYIQFLCTFTLILSTITWFLLNNTVYIETIGFLAVFFEALLGTPQFMRNFRLKSTEGMSVKMVLMWTSGDIFKTVYFILRQAPKQFWLCGSLQIAIDFAILCQVIAYSDKFRGRKR
jgi:uncharacterized protein with PQ loop repeat